MPNEDFSSKIADEKNEGKETDDNFRILWEDEFNFTGEVKGVEETEDSIYQIQGEKDGENFSMSIPNMRIWTISGTDNNQIAISKNVIDHFEINSDKFELWFKEKSVLANVIPGVYIDIDDFPKELQK
jgi:hypothetical protein